MTRSKLGQVVILAATAMALPAMFIGCDNGSAPPPTPSTAPHDRVPATTPTTIGTGGSPLDSLAQAAIARIKADIAKGDISTAKAELADLESKGTYDSLSQSSKDEIDALAKTLPATDVQIPTPTSMPKM